MKIRIPIEDVKLRLPQHIKLDESTYKGVCVKARFIDEKYGEFWSIPKDVFNGHDHRKRANEKISLGKTGSLIKLKQKLPSYLTIKDDSYKGMNKKAIFIDEKYGEFEATPKSIFHGKKHIDRAIQEIPNKRLPVEVIKKRLPDNIVIVEESYINSMSKCKFIDEKYGEFEATPNGVIRNKKTHPIRVKENKKQTCLLKYGVEHPSQNKEIMSKMKRGSRQTNIRVNWETNEEVLCVGGYETKVVDYLNENKISFDWQIPFKLKCGIYYCDLYLKQEDKYVEIKGWWRQQISKDKWEEFHETYSNSELWNRDKLIEMKIIKH